MNLSKRKTEPSLYYKTVIISDTHLGKNAASAEFFLEFLKNMRCKRLILAGDIMEGWGLKSKKRKPFPEMHARCLDAINALAAEGVEIIYLRGNHDEDLARSRYKLMNNTVVFHDRRNEVTSPITFRKSFVHTDAAGKRHLVLHGDVFDNFQKNHGKKKIAKIADVAYDNLVSLNKIFKQAVLNTTGLNISPAAYLKKATKETAGVIGNFERSVAKDSITSQFDGVICGHIHHAEIRQIGNCTYMNSGDWVESCECIVETENGEWHIIDWSQERKRLGLGRPPLITDTNEFHEFRTITERQLRLARRVWPGKDYAHLIKGIRDKSVKIEKLEDKITRAFDKAGNDNREASSQDHKKIISFEEEIAALKFRLQPVLVYKNE